jgi:hypothetical protein
MATGIEIQHRPTLTPNRSLRKNELPSATLVSAVVFALLAGYCFLGHDTKDHRSVFFPPFRPHFNSNSANTLGCEYYYIGKALANGRGFADPFVEQSGPTAWMPPLLPLAMAGLILATGDSVPFMMMALLAIQVASLAFCAFTVRTLLPGRRGWLVSAVFGLFLVMQFRLAFQAAHDYGIVMAALNGCILWDALSNPLRTRRTTILWGVLGGITTLVTPVVGLVWGGLTLRRGIRRGVRKRGILALVLAGLFLAPWTIRNAIVFGRIIPMKSNLFYEFYQSQFETTDGIIGNVLFDHHPANGGLETRVEYKALGEMEFLDRRKAVFLDSVRRDPAEFAARAGRRFLAAFVDYRSFNEDLEPDVPGVIAYSRIVHPLPALAIVVLLAGSPWRRLDRVQLGVIAAYLICLLPYAIISYYDRYAYPLLGLKVLLVIWALERILPGTRSRRGCGTPGVPETGC